MGQLPHHRRGRPRRTKCGVIIRISRSGSLIYKFASQLTSRKCQLGRIVANPPYSAITTSFPSTKRAIHAGMRYLGGRLSLRHRRRRDGRTRQHTPSYRHRGPQESLEYLRLDRPSPKNAPIVLLQRTSCAGYRTLRTPRNRPIPRRQRGRSQLLQLWHLAGCRHGSAAETANPPARRTSRGTRERQRLRGYASTHTRGIAATATTRSGAP